MEKRLAICKKDINKKCKIGESYIYKCDNKLKDKYDICENGKIITTINKEEFEEGFTKIISIDEAISMITDKINLNDYKRIFSPNACKDTPINDYDNEINYIHYLKINDYLLKITWDWRNTELNRPFAIDTLVRTNDLRWNGEKISTLLTVSDVEDLIRMILFITDNNKENN